MWWYNILKDNEGSISHLYGLVLLLLCFTRCQPHFSERENPDPILTVKIIEWRKFVDYSGVSIKADPSRVDKKNIYYFGIGYITSPSSGNPRIARH